MALIKLNNQFVQIIIREIRISEFVDWYLKARVDSLLFFFFYISLWLIFVFNRVSAQEDKASSEDQDRK